MAIVVGYVPRAEGKAALRRAAEEARLRNVPLVVVNSNRGGSHLDDEDAVEHERELADVRAELDAEGIKKRCASSSAGWTRPRTSSPSPRRPPPTSSSSGSVGGRRS